MRGKSLKLGLLTLGLAAAGQHAAYADATTEAQLRGALQSSTTQIAALEDQVANLQASQAPNVAMIDALRAQLQGAHAGSSAADSAKNSAALKALTRQLATTDAELSKTKTADQTAESSATTVAAQNAALKAQLAATTAGLARCDTKNTQLYQLGTQILDAYSHKDDLFGSFANREPFTGIKRVQLENIVQDDQDKLYAGQINPAGTAP